MEHTPLRGDKGSDYQERSDDLEHLFNVHLNLLLVGPGGRVDLDLTDHFARGRLDRSLTD